jgi:hypothetical protein
MVIRIDIHPTGENLINTTHTLPTPVHVQLMYASCRQSPYVITIHESSTYLDGSHYSWEKRLPIQSTARQLTDPRVGAQFLSQANQWRSRLKPSFCWWQATRLTGPISPACDRYVQYLLAGANSSILNQHRKGLKPWRSWLSTYHSPTFPTSYLSFPPKGPTRSQVINQLITI